MPTDIEIIVELRRLHERFESEFRGSIDGIDAWVREQNADAPVIGLLERDTDVANHLTVPGRLFLLDALDIDRTGIVTQSGGTGYGVVVAASAPQRCTGPALLGGLAPLTSREGRMDTGKQLRTAVLLARRAPFVLKAGLRRTFKKLPDSAIAQVPAADRPFLGDPLIRDIHLRTMREFLGNPDAAIEEIRLLARLWGITPPPAGVIQPALWTGELDEAHPPAHARRVAELLGGDPPVTVVPGVGTFGTRPSLPGRLAARCRSLTHHTRRTVRLGGCRGVEIQRGLPAVSRPGPEVRPAHPCV